MFLFKSISDSALRALLESVGDGAWEWDIGTGAVVTSASLFEGLGYPVEERPQTVRALARLVHPHDRSQIGEAFRSIVQGRTHHLDCELRIKARSGEWRWVRERGSVIAFNEEGVPTTFVGTASDITGHKRIEIEAQEANERLRLAQEKAGAGTWDIDLLTGEVRLCPLSLRMHGLSPDLPMPIREEDWAATLHSEDEDRTRWSVREAIENARLFSIEYRTNDGATWVLGTGRAVTDETGRAVRFVGINLDITHRKQAEATIAQMQTQLIHFPG